MSRLRNIIQLRPSHRTCYSTQTPSIPSTSTTGAAEEAPSTSSSEIPLLLPVRPYTSDHPKPTPKDNLRLGAAGLLSRSPLLLKPLTEFEDSYYQYQRDLHHAIDKPIRSSFFFRPGSHAAKAFELSLKSPQSSAPLDPLPPQQTADHSSNFHDIQRNPTRFIHLLFKLVDPSNQKSHWLLPTSRVSGSSDDLTRVSLRAVHTTAGPDMDIWSVGRVPATVYSPPLDSDSRFDKVWVMPQRILRGQPKLQDPKTLASEDTDQTGFLVQDFGWFSSEEVKDRVHLDLWNALEPVLK